MIGKSYSIHELTRTHSIDPLQLIRRLISCHEESSFLPAELFTLHQRHLVTICYFLSILSPYPIIMQISIRTRSLYFKITPDHTLRSSLFPPHFSPWSLLNKTHYSNYWCWAGEIRLLLRSTTDVEIIPSRSQPSSYFSRSSYSQTSRTWKFKIFPVVIIWLVLQESWDSMHTSKWSEFQSDFLSRMAVEIFPNYHDIGKRI